MCNSPDLGHGDGSAVRLDLRMRGNANRAWRGCVAPRQAGFGELGGSKEGAEIDVVGIGDFLAAGDEEVDVKDETSLSDIPEPEPGVTVSTAGDEAGKQVNFPHAGSESGVLMLGVMHGDFHT